MPDIAVIMGGKGPKGPAASEESEEREDVYGMAEEESLSSLVDAAGVPEEKREQFGSALKSYVEACVMKSMRGPSEEKTEKKDD